MLINIFVYLRVKKALCIFVFPTKTIGFETHNGFDSDAKIVSKKKLPKHFLVSFWILTIINK